VSSKSVLPHPCNAERAAIATNGARVAHFPVITTSRPRNHCFPDAGARARQTRRVGKVAGKLSRTTLYGSGCPRSATDDGSGGFVFYVPGGNAARVSRAIAAGVFFFLGTACGGATSLYDSDNMDAGGDAPSDATVTTPSDASADAGAVPSDGPSATAVSDATAPGADAAGCNATTCPSGCCDTDDHCQQGSLVFCGQGGVACQVCPSGMQCQRGVYCACTAESCPIGCCNDSFHLGMEADGGAACLTGFSDTACGGGGADCQDCTSTASVRTGGTCVGQTCSNPPPCQCPILGGCCDRLGQCQPGASNTQCGQSLTGYCQDCTLSGTQCDKGQCTGLPDAAVCNAQTCPNGCCDEFEHCQPGTEMTSCGSFGTGCWDCTIPLPNEPPGSVITCSNQKCVATGCDPTACNGCCDVPSNCADGSDGADCGVGQPPCVDCPDLGDACDHVDGCAAPDGGP
jgi:hypothetical protein